MTTAVSRPLLYTIGHSTRTAEEFLELLQSFKIQVLADIRRFPGSKKFPQFNQEILREHLEAHGIQYIDIEKLGGRRKKSSSPENSRWRNPSFQAYADYMKTAEFEQGAEELAEIATEKTTAIMCSEAVWWRCHRSMVADYFKAKGWEVLHIMGKNKTTEHPYTSPAVVKDGKVYYD